MNVIYANLCPICGKDLTSEEIVCSNCENVFSPLCEFKEDKVVKDFLSFFKKCIGEPRAIQKLWAKRLLRGESFAATAPTGIGKTSFGIVISLYLSSNGKKCYLLFPTSILVKQSVENIQKFIQKIKIKGISIGYYHSNLKKEEREKFFENIQNHNILITTTQFLSRHFEVFKDITFDFIFIDDVDAILKASKNIERILHLLGFYWDKKWKGEAKGCLMVSTATAKKGKKAELFRKLLNFDIGSSNLTVRNIEDIVVNKKNLTILSQILKKLGSGGIIYAKSAKEAEDIYNFLKNNFKIGIVIAGKNEDFEKFEKCELDYLVGTAYYYGTLIRGLDLPEKIRFAVFYGCPVLKLKIEDIENTSPNILRILALIYRNYPEIEKYLPYLNNLEGKKDIIEQLRETIKVLIEKGEKASKDVVIKKGEIIFPDIRTYIQGSGRTSRLFSGGVTKGISFVFEEDTEILSAFLERAKFYELEFKKLEEIDFDFIKKELDETRKRFKRRKEFELIRPTLFIVESPTKAKQISRFFGKPSIKLLNGTVVYEIPMEKFVLLISASIGHITDLITNRGFYGIEVNNEFIPIYASIKRCKSCGYQFTEERKNCPKCGNQDIDDSKKRISALRKLAHDTERVIIGTDPDAEGEKIAWDIKNLLSGCGVVKRAEFHEVTRRAVMESLDNLRDIDENLVKAQIVRRIEDRWIGFGLSQRLWKIFNNKNLSAGRAQTPVLGWIINRFKESRKKKTVAIIKEMDLTLEYDKEEFEVEILFIEERREKKNPLPPYTTDILLKDANQILKLSVQETMQIAQDLFENGMITYHRTDSTRVSDVGLKIAKEYLKEDFAQKEWFMEGAHECIRPTRPIDRDTLHRLIQEGVLQVEGFKWKHFMLYDLIFRRFMASECQPYEVIIKKYKIIFNGKSIEDERIIKAEGRAYQLYKSVYIKKELPIGKFKVKAELKKIPSASLLAQSDIIHMMKEKGIGRPSTYATILNKLFLRNYIFEKGGKIIPTSLGTKVFSYLFSSYQNFVSEERTKILEEKMDAIEKGQFDYIQALQELYEEIKSIG